jgi:hypothetical protein
MNNFTKISGIFSEMKRTLDECTYYFFNLCVVNTYFGPFAWEVKTL